MRRLNRLYHEKTRRLGGRSVGSPKRSEGFDGDIVVRNSGTDEWWVMYNINENELVPFLKKGIEWTDENMSKAINGELK